MSSVMVVKTIQAPHWTLTLAADRLKQLGAFCQKTANAFFDAIINTVLQCVGFSKNKLAIA
jgi:hypothetical protein